MVQIIGSKFIRSEHKEARHNQSGVERVIAEYLSKGYLIVNESDRRTILGKPSQAILWLEEDDGKRYIVDFHGRIKAFYKKEALHLATFNRFLRDYYNGVIRIAKNDYDEYYIQVVEKKKKGNK